MRIRNSITEIVLVSLLFLPGCSGSSSQESKAIPEQAEPAPAAPAAPAEVQRQEPPTPKPAPQQTERRVRPPAVAAIPAEAAPQVVVTPPAPPPPPIPEPAVISPAPESPEPPEPAMHQVAIPAGTVVSIRMIDSIDSATSHADQTFRASLDTPIMVAEQVVVPKGADVYVKLTHVESAGNLKGQSEVTLQLDRIFAGNKFYTVTSNVYERSGESQGKETAKNTAIGAAIGAAVGAIAGGKKGAAIGAGAGAGVGVAIEAATKGEQIRVEAEAKLDFRLEHPLDVTIEYEPPATPKNLLSPSSPGPARLGSGPAPLSKDADSSADENLSGEWDLSMDTPQGKRKMRLVLEQTGHRLEGTLDNFGRSQEVRGNVRGRSVGFSTESEMLGQITRMQFEGDIIGDRLRGTVTVDRGRVRAGRSGRHGATRQTFDWTAKRR